MSEAVCHKLCYLGNNVIIALFWPLAAHNLPCLIIHNDKPATCAPRGCRFFFNNIDGVMRTGFDTVGLKTQSPALSALFLEKQHDEIVDNTCDTILENYNVIVPRTKSTQNA